MIINGDIREKLKAENAGEMSPRQLYRFITGAIEPFMPKLYMPGETPYAIFPGLDYGKSSYGARWEKVSEIREIGNWTCIRADMQPGGSEGLYLDVSIETVDVFESPRVAHETPLFTFKTLDETPAAYAAMAALGGMIQYALELFLIINEI